MFGCAKRLRAIYIILLSQVGKYDNRNFFESLVFFNVLQNVKTAHTREHKIQQYDVRSFFFENVQSLLTIARMKRHGTFGDQFCSEKLAKERIVLDPENFSSLQFFPCLT